MDIKGKVAIVTGGTGGIGFATAQELLKHGAKHVAILDVKETTGRAATCIEKLDKEFGKGRASFHVCDVTKKDDFAAIYDDVTKTQKTVDILVNNAGILSDAQGDLMIDINLKGVINCTLSAIERMGKHNKGNGGTIVNVCSVVGLTAYPAFPIYVATKHGVYGFTKALKEHYDNIGVRAMAVCPGVTQTNFLERVWRKEALGFVHDTFLDKLLHCSDTIQPPENVATAIVKMIQEGEPGAVWVSDENEPPYAVKDVPHYKERKITS